MVIFDAGQRAFAGGGGAKSAPPAPAQHTLSEYASRRAEQPTEKTPNHKRTPRAPATEGTPARPRRGATPQAEKASR